ncbi:amino-acid permease BAT1 protein [Trifolium repens]|nr:amino-acid permease BAT1 protein [Trifolium repens]
MATYDTDKYKEGFSANLLCSLNLFDLEDREDEATKEVFYLAFNRYGHEFGGIICLGIVVVAILICGMSSITANPRVAYDFSRDWGHAIVIIIVA